MSRRPARPPIRWRAVRRGLLLVVTAAIVAASMASAVKRGAEARRLSRDLEALQRTEQITRERLAEVRWRADSLASRARIAAVGPELGLRPATERDIVFLAEPRTAAGVADPGDGGRRGTR